MPTPTIHKKLKRQKNRFEVQQFFRYYQNSLKTKELFFEYPFVTPNIIELLKRLEKDSRIAGYHVTTLNHKVKVFLKYELSRNEPLYQKIVFFSTRGRKLIVSAKTLKVFHEQYPNSFAIIGTSFGWMTSKECVAKNYGGEFLLAIS